MSAPQRDEFTRILSRIGAGDESATPEMMALLYKELHAIADGLMRGERAHHTLQPTALVHEAFLRLLGSENLSSKGRLQFLDAAAVTMRRVLVDYARRGAAQKRGGGQERITLAGIEAGEAGDPGGAGDAIDLIALEQALAKLETLDPRQAKIVELRFFSGMSGQQIADHLGVSRNTVVRELTVSRAWLRRELGEPSEGPEPPA